MTLTLNNLAFNGLIDTGANRTGISNKHCTHTPPGWEKESAGAVWGIGGERPASQSATWLKVGPTLSSAINSPHSF